ncbi:MAG: hypothetical protein PVJ57_19700 [Phycisphaerae bacterium]|jgi:hypothetical protein
MVRRTVAVGWLVSLACVLTLGAGCSSALWFYLTEDRSGTISVIFVNDTDYRAVFSFGTYDALDRNPPGTAQLVQLRLEAHDTSSASSLTCRRNMAVGTEEFRQRVVDTDADNVTGFDADAFNDDVYFSDQPVDSDLAAVPTAGTALGIEKIIGVDYECGDTLIFTFVQDPDAPGGFRIDYTLIRAAEPE